MANYEEIGAWNRQPENINILTNVKFKFNLHKLPGVNFFCQEANLPDIQGGVAVQNTMFNKLPLPGDELIWAPLELTYLVDEDLNNYIEVFNWLRGINLPVNFDQYSQIKKSRTDLNPKFGGLWCDGILHILSNESNPKVNVIFKDCFPVSQTGLHFRTTETDSVPLTATVQFRYAYYEFERVV